LTRLYREAGLERGTRPDGHTRLRWQAVHAGALWHGDVCHGPALRVGGTTMPLRIHALLHDASRYVVALEARHTERVADMLDLMLAALRRHGAPDGVYLDNGSTCRGDGLRLCCERLDITLVHARPGDAPARGKTCVLRALRHRIPAAGFRLTYCHNATLGRRDFYRQLCTALQLSPAATAGSLFHAVARHVEERSEERIHPVFLLDEAHLLHQDTLDHLHILLNYHWDSRALLSLVLVGLPELRDRLALRRNRSLHSRLHHRLEIELFASDAVAMLHEATAGAMRDLDRLAAAALRETAREKRKLVERDVVSRVIEADTRERDR
jgi:transposase InsO family protein